MHEGRLRLGWKVTTKEGRSAVQSVSDSFGGVYYHIGERTVPQAYCGPLTVFRNKKAAKIFENKMSGTFKINRCVYFASKEKEVWYSYEIKTSLRDLFLLNRASIPDPKSITLADWVMLIPEK